MEYFTHWINRSIYSSSGEVIGKADDLVGAMLEPMPVAVAVSVKSKLGNRLIPISEITIADKKACLKREWDAISTYELQPDDFFIRKALLDKQILDLHGKRVVRVNDVSLIWRWDKLYIVGIEAGLISLLRRLGAAGLVKKIPKKLRRKLSQQIISWDQVETLKGFVKLSVPHEKIAQLHPADIADIVEQLNPMQRKEVFEALDVETAADTLEETEPEVSKEIIQSLDVEKAADIVEEMEPDEAADLLGELSDDRAEALLEHMEVEEAAEVKELLNYDEDTAGGMMTTEFVSVPNNLTCQQTIDRLRELHPDAETIYYVYVVDEDEQLVGVLSLRELIISPPETLISDIMRKTVISVHTQTEEADVVQKIEKYGLLALPVVDVENRLQGIITVDDTMSALLLAMQKRSKSQMSQD